MTFRETVRLILLVVCAFDIFGLQLFLFGILDISSDKAIGLGFLAAALATGAAILSIQDTIDF